MSEDDLGTLLLLLLTCGFVLVFVYLIRRSNRLERERNTQLQIDRKSWEENESRRKDWIEQEAYRQRLVQINGDALSAFEMAIQRLSQAEEYLDQAERDFMEGAFAPFWDSVERAAVALGGFDGGVDAVGRASTEFLTVASRFRQPVSFAVTKNGAAKLAIGRATSDRMAAIVRRAQRSFEFSVIYEQRKTNQILVTGFRNLADALERMSEQISASIYALAESVDSMGDRLNESIRLVHAEMKDLNDFSREQSAELERDAAARVVREEQVVEMLDNIQRHRYPSYFHGGMR